MSSERQGSTNGSNDGEPEPVSSPQSTAELDIQRLGLGRSSSPAKRSFADRGGDDDDEQTQHDVELDSANRARSPKKSNHELASSMPSRSKPIPSIETDDGGGDAMMKVGDDDETESRQLTVEKVVGHGQASNPPPLDEQVTTIQRLSNDIQPEEGDKGYVISCRWLQRVQSRTTSGLHENHPKDSREGEIGPVDNSDIVANDNFYGELKDQAGEKFVPLKQGLLWDEDYVCLPPEAWDLIMQWYGVAEASHIIVRYNRNTAPPGSLKHQFQYECYPPILTIQKLRDDSGGVEHGALLERSAPAPFVVASRTERYQAFLKRVKAAANIDMKTKVKVWRMLDIPEPAIKDSGIPTPATTRENSPVAPSSLGRVQPKLVIDLHAFNNFIEGTHRELVTLKDETANEKYNGSSTLDMAGVDGPQQTLILEEQIRGGGEEFVSDKMKKAASQNGIELESSQELTSRQGVRTRANASQARQSPPSGALTRTKNKKGRTRGCTGLSNMGNTCYMNSGLQCIRSVEELAIYFLEGKHKAELNSDNPLGHNGQIAKAYETFLTSAYDPTSTGGSYTPRNFKNALGRCAPLFSGYGQQDSQEFLSFLVDGLHEDLNRIHKKPYRENPDSDDKRVHDPEYIKELGQVYRDNHRARNDSVAMDLFSGFYKNTMICPVCDKVSVTFDPYSLLTLQLPIESTFQHVFTFAPLGGHPVNVNIDIDKNSNIRMVKEYVAKRFPGTKAENLVMAEQYNQKFYKIFEDSEVVAEANIQANDKVWLFELDGVPTNLTAGKAQKAKLGAGKRLSESDLQNAEHALSKRMAIPVINRCLDVSRGEFQLRPWILLITREEAKDLEKIKRKVLRMVQSMTTRELFPASDGPRLEEDKSVDTVLVSREDENDRIQARSVESEDSLVDITMTDGRNDANIVGSTHAGKGGSPAKVSPALDPNYFIDPLLANSFNILLYGAGGNEPIPTGWSSLNVSGDLTKIESRIERPESRRQSRQSNSSFTGRGRDMLTPAGSDDELGRDGQSAATSDGEELNVPPRSPRGGKFRQAMGGVKRSLSRALRRGERRSSSSAPQQDLLIRPGEGFVLDWHPDAFTQLFGGESKDSMRGVPTVDERDIPTHEDKELEARKAKRADRKKSGVKLEECFEETSKSEVLSEENAWYCGRCKELRRATKTLEIWTAPDILVIHLKRFSSTSRLRDKIDVLVDAPVEGLNLAGKVGLPEDKGLIYDLFAVDNHYGGLGGGHYTAYAQNFFDKQWYEYNDSSVSSANPNGVVTRAAYLLFYRRRSDKPLGPPYLQDIVTNAYNASTSDSSSSLSGEDQRPDDSSSPNGSSTSSLEAAAGAGPLSERIQNSKNNTRLNSNGQRLAGFNGGLDQDAETGAEMGTTRSKRALIDRDEDGPPPSYGQREYDEGIGMGDDTGMGGFMHPDEPLMGYEDRQNQHPFDDPGWSFNRLENADGSDDDMKDADESGHNSIGSNPSDRMQDFPDDDRDQPLGIDQGDDYGYDGHDARYFEHLDVGSGLKGGAEDGEVHELRLGDDHLDEYAG